MGRVLDSDFKIRIPVNIIQMTERDGTAWPIAFDWNENGETARIEIDRVLSRMPLAEQKAGVVGDCYSCTINGAPEDLYYSVLAPRKWFRLVPVDETTYKRYYRLPDEHSDR